MKCVSNMSWIDLDFKDEDILIWVTIMIIFNND